MAHSFKTNPGKSSFGVFSEPLEGGEYILNKKAKTTYCAPNNCTPRVRVGSESNLLLFRRSSRLSLYPCKNSINKANLCINLISTMDLEGVPVIMDFSGNQVPSAIRNDAIPYLDYNVDPCGNLFGNTTCGVNNYVQYMKYSFPYVFDSYVPVDFGGPDAIVNAFDLPAFKNWHCPVTNNWYKVAPNGYTLSSFSQTGLTTPNSIMSIAFLYDCLANHGNWRSIFRFTDNNSDTTNSRIPALFTGSGRNFLHFGFQTSSSSNSVVESAVLPLNTAFLVTAVITATTFTLYVNKTLVRSQTYGSIAGRNTNTRLIIGDNFFPSNGNVLIKDLTLYDGALSQTDVNNIYDNLTNMPPA
jgi:hypothetical protein